MHRVAGWVVLLFLVVFSLSVWAQGTPSGGGGGPIAGQMANTGPTPLGGYSTHMALCQGVNYQKLIVCDTPPCNRNSVPICDTPYAFTSSFSCVAPATINEWGITTSNIFDSACCPPTGACQDLSTAAWSVGVFDSSPLAQLVPNPIFDSRTSRMVKMSPYEWVVVFESAAGARLTSTSDGGVTWSTSFLLENMISQLSVPSGYTFSTLEVHEPTLRIGRGANVFLTFVVRDPVSGKGSIYFSECGDLPCATTGDWSSPTRIIDPAVDEVGGLWRYKWSNPQLVVSLTEKIHVVFDDGETDPLVRIPGVFHRFCEHGVQGSCTLLAQWTQSSAGPDITNGSDAGYARDPHAVITSDEHVHVVWLDNTLEGNPANTTLRYSFFDPSTGVWVPYSDVSHSAPQFSFPMLASSDTRLLAGVLEGVQFHAWECEDPCYGSILPAVWDDVSVEFSALDTLNAPREFVLLLSPYDEDESVVLVSSQVGTKFEMFGLFNDDGFPSGPHRLSNVTGGGTMVGISDTWGNSEFASGLSKRLDVLSANATSGGGLVRSIEVWSSPNSSPSVDLVSPLNGGTWTNPNSPSSSADYLETVVISVQEDDVEDGLYASFYLSPTPGGTTYPLALYRDLVYYQSLPDTGPEFCEGSDFSSGEDCTIQLPLFSPFGFSAPDGAYYLNVVLTDSQGVVSTDSTSSPITLNASAATLSVTSPSPGSTWSPLTPGNYSFSINNAVFGQSLGLDVTGTPNGSSPLTFPSLGVATLTSSTPAASPGCVKVGANYTCTLSFTSGSSTPEGVYALTLSPEQDGLAQSGSTVANVTIDYHAPTLLNPSPTGTVTTPPSQVTFTLQDISSPSPSNVTVNGTAVTPSCTPGTGNTVNCGFALPSSITSGLVTVSMNANDAVGNSDGGSFSFTIGEEATTGSGGDGGSGGGGGGGVGAGVGSGGGFIPNLDDLVTQNENGDIVVTGTPIVIPKTIVDTVNNFSNNVVLSASNVVEVAGPSSNAIFIGLCVVGGLASDVVFRRVFSGVRSEFHMQRERVVRTLLAGIFFAVPLMVGLTFSLAIGFVFVVLEIVGFIAGSYIFKVLQYNEAFGYKPLQAV